MNDQSVLSIIQKIAPGLYFIGGLVVKHLWDTFINKISKIHYFV